MRTVAAGGRTTMSEPADRYRKVSGAFTWRVESVADDAWELPAPCEGWVARDVVGHLVEWLPAFFFGTFDLDHPPVPSVDRDPVAAWTVVNDTIQRGLDDAAVASRVRATRMGDWTFEQTVDTICTPDVLVHTWDLARAVGLDDHLDAEEVHRFVVAMEPMDAMLRASGQYGPRVPVPDDADEQTRLVAFLGRQP
jgi:uncharacterized protein (TIGR03086 family)